MSGQDLVAPPRRYFAAFRAKVIKNPRYGVSPSAPTRRTRSNYFDGSARPCTLTPYPWHIGECANDEGAARSLGGAIREC
jgi:hypothetical protein